MKNNQRNNLLRLCLIILPSFFLSFYASASTDDEIRIARDKLLAARQSDSTNSSIDLRETYSLSSLPVFDQGSLGSSAASAIVYSLMAQQKIEAINAKLSALYPQEFIQQQRSQSLFEYYERRVNNQGSLESSTDLSFVTLSPFSSEEVSLQQGSSAEYPQEFSQQQG